MNKRIFFAGSKNGFTLAEVLIVLTIIGIIAAITIPIVISSINNQKFITGLQKANNTFSNVINASQADVKMESWDFSKDTTSLAKTSNVRLLPSGTPKGFPQSLKSPMLVSNAKNHCSWCGL